MSSVDADKIRHEFGYDGKPLQWKLGFDALLRHLPTYILVGMQEEKKRNKEKVS